MAGIRVFHSTSCASKTEPRAANAASKCRIQLTDLQAELQVANQEYQEASKANERDGIVRCFEIFDTLSGLRQHATMSGDSSHAETNVTDADHQALDVGTEATGHVTSNIATLNAVSQILQGAEKEKLQAALLQSQKIESVGRLTEGVAHAFNNMLTVILGNCEMLLLNDSLSSQQKTQLKAIQAAGQRSADLTRQLLTFARRRNSAPEEIDPNKAVRAMLDLLRTSIGEDVQLDWLPGKGIGTVLIDPGQLDQILVILCISSRDSIPGPGRILISTQYENIQQRRQLFTSELDAGEYVVLTVADSGCWMNEGALTPLFQPIDNSKPIGEISGSRLDAVHNIVQQVGGGVDAHSHPATGTTIRIYLPQTTTTKGARKPNSGSRRSVSLREQNATVLFVEDEPVLLRMGNILLTKLGYTVLSARNGREARQLIQSHGSSIEIVISDIVLPDLNGRELARRISGIQPEIRFVFMTGYRAEQEKTDWPAQHPVPVLIKPFNLDRLATAIRDAVRIPKLDQESAPD